MSDQRIELVRCIHSSCETSAISRFERKPTPRNETIRWISPPKNVLIITKKNDEEAAKARNEAALWLAKEKQLHVLVPDDSALPDSCAPYCKKISKDDSAVRDNIDLIICLGGDGTLLYITHMFPQAVPPIIAFNMGSLGFLATLKIEDFKKELTKILDNGDVYVNIRNRLEAKVYQAPTEDSGQSGTRPNVYQVLNEIVIDRGTSPFLTELDCYCDDQLVTTIQADGVIISTATGSTAYSMAAGGSMVHPDVPCMLLTPICAHSLSFRPIVLPDSVSLRIEVPKSARGTAWVSLDGRDRTELKQGAKVKIHASKWPAPTLCRTESTTEWFCSLAEKLNWSKREAKQKPFKICCDENDSESSNITTTSAPAAASVATVLESSASNEKQAGESTAKSKTIEKSKI